MDIKQMAHSEVWVDAESPSFLDLARFLSRWWVCLLPCLVVNGHPFVFHLLEIVQSLLPTTIAFDTDLDTTEYHLFAATEVDTKLDDIAILNPKWFRLDVGLTQADVIQKGTRRTLDVLDIPITILAPQLAVLATDHLGFESDGSG